MPSRDFDLGAGGEDGDEPAGAPWRHRSDAVETDQCTPMGARESVRAEAFFEIAQRLADEIAAPPDPQPYVGTGRPRRLRW